VRERKVVRGVEAMRKRKAMQELEVVQEPEAVRELETMREWKAVLGTAAVQAPELRKRSRSQEKRMR
ncbi:MAG: hypothetical protein ACLTC4_12100, partial [Hungatella hathewayi]